jgi:hypothetical protein
MATQLGADGRLDLADAGDKKTGSGSCSGCEDGQCDQRRGDDRGQLHGGAFPSVGYSAPPCCIPLTNAVMNHAPEGEDGSASAFRSAAANVGGAVGVVVMSTIVFTTFSAALTSTLKSEGLNTQQSAKIAERLRNGASSEDVSADYSVPLKQVKLVGDAERGGLVDGLRAHGLSGAAFTGNCLLIFYWSQRPEKKSSRPVRPGD